MATLTAADPKLPLLGTPDCLAPEVRTFTQSSFLKHITTVIVINMSPCASIYHMSLGAVVR